MQENQQIFAPLNRSVCQLVCTERKHVLLSLSRLSYSIYYNIMVFRVKPRYSIPFRLYNAYQIHPQQLQRTGFLYSSPSARSIVVRTTHVNICVRVYVSRDEMNRRYDTIILYVREYRIFAFVGM